MLEQFGKNLMWSLENKVQKRRFLLHIRCFPVNVNVCLNVSTQKIMGLDQISLASLNILVCLSISWEIWNRSIHLRVEHNAVALHLTNTIVKCPVAEDFEDIFTIDFEFYRNMFAGGFRDMCICTDKQTQN